MAKKEQNSKKPEFCINFGKHLRELRNKKKLSIEEIAFKADWMLKT